MPLPALGLWAVIAMAIPSIVTRVMYALGIGFVVYQGFSGVVDNVIGAIQSNLNSAPAELMGVLGILGIGRAIDILLGALVLRMIISGLTAAGGARRMKWRN